MIKSEMAKPVYIVINEQGFSINSTRLYYAISTARGVISGKTTEWLKRRKQYEKMKVAEGDTTSWAAKAKQQYAGEPPKLTILEGTISWKEVS